MFRYPVKSMRGESLNSADVTEQGLLGDRNFGIIDPATFDDATDEFPEDAWVGSTLTIGGISLDILKRCDRCPLVNRAVASAPTDRDVLRALHHEHGGDLGAKAAIVHGGRVRVGDPVRVV